MAVILNVTRKSPVLKRPALPCLSHYHTVNLLAGCPYECRYCYAQSFRSNPGKGKVHFYHNTFDLLRRELPHKREKPVCVYFSTACEPFVPNQLVLDLLFNVMKLLLDYGIPLLISTKSSIPERFIHLFTQFPGMVNVQIGLTTAEEKVRQLLEPNAFPVKARLESLKALYDHNISAEIRMDPLIPGLTDTEQSFNMLCKQIAHYGATKAAVSYLFIRRGNFHSMNFSFECWSYHEIEQALYTKIIDKYCGHGSIRIPDKEYRRESYKRLKEIADKNGLTLRMCGCKNPDLTQDCCHPDMSTQARSYVQLDIFSERRH